MEIHNHGKNLRVHFPVKSAAQNSNSAGGLNSGSDIKSNDANKQRLLEKLEKGEPVRQRLLVEIQARIQAGEYQTRAAAEQAAAALLGQ